ncbi:MAG: hypothetical protein L0Y79_10865 [Chlorobi bacterium]|nr:hypothetical protein [Chlorobiota bacterium]MCI0715558.1 hypothetical protein [Chlorobiota bacterium]
MKKLILILFILIKFSFSQVWINDSFSTYLNKNYIMNLVNSNDELWLLNYNKIIRYSKGHFESFWFDNNAIGNLSKFKEGNATNTIWENISSNNNSICIYKKNMDSLVFLIISNNHVKNIKIERSEISYASSINLDGNNIIWFIGNLENNLKPEIYYLHDESLNRFPLVLNDTLHGYRINKLFVINLEKYIVFSKIIKNFRVSSFILKLDNQNNYNFINFPDYEMNKNGFIVYNFYFNNDKLYILNNYSDLAIVDSDIKMLNIDEDYLGECFSFIVQKNILYYAYTTSNTEVNLTEININDLKKENFSLPNVYNLGVKSLTLFDGHLIGLSGSCSNEWASNIFKFKIK